MATQPGLFDDEERLQRLSDIGDQIEAYAAVVDFELFRPDLEAALGYSDGAMGGRPLLPAHVRRDDARRSRERAPVEHVFAVQKQAMGLMIRTIGLARARTKVGMANLAFNLRRLVQLRSRVTA